MPLLGTRGAASARGFGLLARSGTPPGQQQYTAAGTYSWVCPAGVTSVSVVCVGGGGSGNAISNTAGGGGGLGYKNNISVTPGQSYTVVVGAGGPRGANGTAGGDSYFINTSTVRGRGGASNPNVSVGSSGGSYTGDGGGNGGTGGWEYGGGGGAGGYSGTGGSGGFFNTSSGTSGSGGGGGGGAKNISRTYAAGGGGVGIIGQSANGAGGISFFDAAGDFGAPNEWVAEGGGGGSTGVPGGYGFISPDPYQAIAGGGGFYGGGGGVETSPAVLPGDDVGEAGGVGAVRIIWPGTTRQFPSTNTGNV